MIIGAHAIIYSSDPEADRSFFRDVLKLTNVDIGHGWLIFGLPPSEIAVHPSTNSDAHEFYLLCDDIKLFTREMAKHKITCSPVQQERWGILTQVMLPGGGAIGVYQPLHARPKPMKIKKSPAKKVVPAKKKVRKK